MTDSQRPWHDAQHPAVDAQRPWLEAAGDTENQWAVIATENGRLLTEAITKLTLAERERDGWELIAADQAALVKQVLADLTTACDDLDAVERRAAAAERENEELRATLGAAAQAGVELGQKLAAVYVERDTALESLDIAYGWLTTACGARDAATARERAAREVAQRILSDFHWAAYHKGAVVMCPNDVCAAHHAALGEGD